MTLPNGESKYSFHRAKIERYPLYEFGSNGQVYYRGKPLSQRLIKGIAHVDIMTNYKRPTPVARCILEAFVGEPIVRRNVLKPLHIDGDSCNCTLSNLCWGFVSKQLVGITFEQVRSDPTLLQGRNLKALFIKALLRDIEYLESKETPVENLTYVI